MDSVFTSILLACAFLLEIWLHWYWEILMTSDIISWNLSFVCVCVCVCTCFLCFIGYSYPSCVWDFLLVFSVGLDLCIHIPWTWLCLEISSFLYLYLLRVCLGKSQGWHLLIFRGCRISICPGSFSFESPFWEFSHNSNSSTFAIFLAFFSCCF